MDEAHKTGPTDDLEQLLGRIESHVQQEHRSTAKIKRRLHRVWGESFDLLIGLLYESRDLGGHFLESEYEAARASNDLVFFAVMHLHAEGCLITGEILTLLTTGFSSGAYRCWRSLHEVAAYSMFIVKHGPRTAERYLKHAHIKDWEDMPVLDKLLKGSGGEGFTTADAEMLEKLRARLLQRYGDEFKGGLGWAKEACPKKGGLSFKDIADDVGLGTLDAFYRAASHAVHPTWKGIQDNHEIPPDRQGEGLQSGPSEFGIWTPAMLTARSIYSATLAFLTCRNSSAWLSNLSQLSELVEYTSAQLQTTNCSTSIE
jgi:hypothetical protein